MTPRIAIPLPTSSDLAFNAQNWQSYADAIHSSAAEPVKFPLHLSRSEALGLGATCDAICLPGSPSDVLPAKYAQPADPATAPADAAREFLDELLLDHAFHLRKPILAICYGVQILNVWRGGTLIQDLAPVPVNHSAGRSVAIAHNAAIAPHSLLATMLNQEEALETDGLLRLTINSSHHQAIAIPGAGLKIAARCPQDSVIEAVELDDSELPTPGHFVLGVQWHPERTYTSSPTSRAIFDRFVHEAAVWSFLSAAAIAL